MLRTLAALAFASFALSAPAAAQEPTTEYRFDDADQVEGHIQSADDAFITLGIRHGRRSLLRPRGAFVNELTKSVEDL